jgi:exopolyphosphatase / guanosine-5'-triphosphate,3'-diphosphate pyrophosphatase
VSAFGDQIIEPAREVGRKYQTSEAHGEHVAQLCRTLFATLHPEHKLNPWHELLLIVAALLHEIGHFVSERSHHKHAMYLIANSELFGLSRRDRLVVALLARYHRRSSPKPTHEGYMDLDKEDRVVVVKLAAILRVADALDSSYSQRVREIRCVREPGRLIIETPGVVDLSMETLSLRGKATMFQDVYGMEVVLRGCA